MKYNKLVICGLLASTISAIELDTSMEQKLNANNKNGAVAVANLKTKSLNELESELDSESLETTKEEVMAKWGFLKNIVNIDRFFASAEGDAKPAKEEKKEEAKEEKKEEAKALTQSDSLVQKSDPSTKKLLKKLEKLEDRDVDDDDTDNTDKQTKSTDRTDKSTLHTDKTDKTDKTEKAGEWADKHEKAGSGKEEDRINSFDSADEAD